MKHSNTETQEHGNTKTQQRNLIKKQIKYKNNKQKLIIKVYNIIQTKKKTIKNKKSKIE